MRVCCTLSQLKVDIIYKAVFTLANRVQGRSPCKKKRCHPEERPQAYATKDLVPPPIYKGRRGAYTVEFDVNNRKTKVQPLC